MASLNLETKRKLEEHAREYSIRQRELFDFGDEYRSYFEEVIATQDIELMQEVCDTLPENYWQFEFRRQIRFLKDRLGN